MITEKASSAREALLGPPEATIAATEILTIVTIIKMTGRIKS